MVQSAFMSAMLSGLSTGASGSAWFDRLRAAALERANELSVPTTRDEEWRFTDLAGLARMSFQPAANAGDVDEAAAGANFLPEAPVRLVFVDGHYSTRMSHVPQGAGPKVLGLREALAQCPGLMESHLGRIAAFEADVFAALNTAFLREAAVILVGADETVGAPVHVLHIATKHGQPHAVYPRTIVVAGRGSRCALVEDYLALGDGAYFSAPVTELWLDAGAAVSHVRLQREAADAYHLGRCSVRQAESSRYDVVALAFGARLSRLDLEVVHAGPACKTLIDGLALVGRRQLADTHSTVDHAHPQGKLRQVHKCVVGGGAHAVFNGKILVREGAQQTDAGQSCRGLLLSDRAQIDAKPQLEIYADDVKCAHGAAIGQLDPEEMFYLQSRGLSADRARNLLTYAFAAEVMDRVPVASLRSRLARTLLERTQEAA